MTPQAYKKALDRALEFALENDGNWNDLYLAGLKANGLTHSAQPVADHIVRAPRPTRDQPDRWPEKTYVVPITPQSEKREWFEAADEPELRAWLESRNGLKDQINYLRLRNIARDRGEEHLFDTVLEQVARYAFRQARFAYGPQ